MSFIETIEIKNFKSIRHQKIEGCRKINVFIGYPNVGKSNILEALSNFSVGGESRLYSDYVRMGKSTTLFFNGNIDKASQVILNGYFRVFIEFKKNGLNAKVELDRLNEGFESIDRQMDSYLFMEKSDISDKYIYELGSFKVNENTSELVLQGNLDLRLFEFEVENKTASNVKQKIPLVRYSFKKGIQYNGNDAWKLKHPFGSNIFEVISTKPELNENVIDLFNSYQLKFVYDAGSEEYKILKMLGNKIFTIPYTMIADTLQRLIFHKAAIASNQNSVLIFEEPEAHMFPPYIKKLTTDILLDKTNQFFMATHSPYVLDELILEAGDDLAVYLVDYKDGETIVHHVSNDDLSEIREYGVDLFFNLESYLKHGQINNT